MLRVKDVEIRLFNMRTRLPFRYGIVTLRACPHLFLRLTVDVDGQAHTGLAADHLPPKWFTKDPQTPYEQDVRDMLAVIRHAADRAVMTGAKGDAFSLVTSLYGVQRVWGQARHFPPLLYNFGLSLVERAVIDAVCRARRTTFAQAVRQNLLGVQFAAAAGGREMLDYPELAGTAPADWLPPAPLREITARHTVGLLDALTDRDIPPDQRVDDGLPQSLEAAIRYYGLRHFKLKIAGDVEKDLDRLKRIFAVIGGAARGEWAYSLDGNENYTRMADFRTLWESLQSDDTLRQPLSRLLFVEQPLHRDVALSDEVMAELPTWADRPPIIIDESDGYFGALPRALACGYVGTSHKNCKGVIKGIAGACLLEHHRRREPGRTFIMSGEDLSNVGPVALLQDLAVCATLGIQSVERNSQHYFKGLSMHSRELQEQVLARHGDLYRLQVAGQYATLRIHNGNVSVGTVVDAPFGVGFDPDLSRFPTLDQWRFDPG